MKKTSYLIMFFADEHNNNNGEKIMGEEIRPGGERIARGRMDISKI
jgi:hypothetical protein